MGELNGSGMAMGGVPSIAICHNWRGQEILTHLTWAIRAVAVLETGPHRDREQWAHRAGRQWGLHRFCHRGRT